MLGDDRVAELQVEAEVAGKLAANADSHLAVLLGVGVVVDPAHERRPDPLALPGRIDRDPTDVQVARLAIEAQTADRTPIELSQGATGSLEIIADGCL
jgi:hypothetical protein